MNNNPNADTRITVRITVRILDEELAAIDRYHAGHGRPTRSHVLREALTQFLSREGFADAALNGLRASETPKAPRRPRKS